MGLDLDNRSRVSPNQDKYVMPSIAGFSSAKVPLAAICELQPTSCADVSIHSLNQRDTLSVLMLNTYRHWLIRGLGVQADHFQQCTKLSTKRLSRN